MSENPETDHSSLRARTGQAATSWLSRVNINVRLALCFVLIVLLMLIGNGLLLWQSQIMRTQASRLKAMDEQFIEVLRVHDVLLSFDRKVREIVRSRDLSALQQSAPAMRSTLQESLRHTETVFRNFPPETKADRSTLAALETIQSPLEQQLDTLVALASAGDWDAVRSRLDIQVGSLEDLSSALVETIQQDVDRKRSEAAADIEHAQVRTLYILTFAAAITLLVAAFLGLAITQSITGPLRSLLTGAAALARGDFNHRVPIEGRDELAHLGGAFNNTIVQLRDLYGELQSRETYLAEAQELSHTGSFGWSIAGDQFFWSDETLRIFQYDSAAEAPTLATILSRIHPEDRETVRQAIALASRDQQQFDVEFRLRLRDGSVRHAHVVAHRVHREGGEQFVGAVMDVTAARDAWEEIQTLKDQLYKENIALREEIDKVSMFEEIVGSSDALRKVLVDVAKVAKTDSTVLILGETGTGKELIARAIHKRSERAARAFIRVNCAAIPQTLIASELFGHEKGAFTGATQRRLGRFELADGGTIFLDEIGELPAETQVSLLRVLQEREFERIGGTQSISVNVRVLAATNRDLQSAVQSGTFRQDLFYRLNVFPLRVPALRERADDIPLLVEYMIERYSKRTGKRITSISKRTMDLFQNYPWPGNIRELQNVVERAVILTDGQTFDVDDQWLRSEDISTATLPFTSAASLGRLDPDREREMIEAALRATQGRISGPSGAAARLGIPRQTLESKIARLGIEKHHFRSA
jgi:PAS domain S-box-containing protein